MDRTSKSRYIVKSVMHGAQVMEAFRADGELLRLRDVVQRPGLQKVMCFRLLYTLHLCGFGEKVGENQYRAMPHLQPNRRYRLGYAGLGQNASFPREVASSLVQAAESVAPAIAGKFMDAGIPMTAIDIPHPGATYFGANNYGAGLIGGRHLGRWANKNWANTLDEIVMIEITHSASVPQARVRGMIAGWNEVLRNIDMNRIVHLDGDGQFGPSLDCVRPKRNGF